MKVVLSVVFFALSVVVSGVAQAQSIAVVDTQRVINDSIIGKAARNDLEAEIKKSQAKLAQMKGEFEKQKSDLEKQSSILSGSALEEKREQLSKKQVEFQRAYQDMQEKLSRDNEREISKVIKQINAAVEQLAKERKYDFVFERDRQAVVFFSEEIDITGDVVRLLDKQKVAL